MEELDYWDRMYSQERRRERYSIRFLASPRRGRLADVHSLPLHAVPAVRKAREGSLRVKGARLFNLIPKELRDMTGTVDQFKAGLDSWLSSIPDQPTVPGRQRAAQTNSLIDQVLYAQK